MEKNRKRKRIIAVFLTGIIAFSFALVPVGAVSAGPYMTSKPFGTMSRMDNYLPTNLPFSLGFINDLTRGDTQGTEPENFVLTTPSNVLAQGGRLVNGTDYYQPVTQGDYVYRNDNDIVNDDGQVVIDVFDNLYLQKSSWETFGIETYDKDNNVNATYSVMQVDIARCIGIRNPLNTQAQLPFGFQMRANNLTLCPAVYEQYLSPEYWGSNDVFGNIHAQRGIGGFFLFTDDTSNYNNSTISWDIHYTTGTGIEGHWQSGNESWNNYKNYNYGTIRAPLIPISFIENFTEMPVLYIDSVDVTIYGDIQYLDTDSATYFIYTVDSLWLTTDESNESSTLYYDIPVINKIRNNYLREGVNQNYTAEWNGLTSWLASAVGGFFSFELGYGITFGGILTILLGFSFVFLFLKFFAGG